MNIVFRTDASLQIGTGHVMRCLALARALRAQGGRCQFICREHPGNLNSFIRQQGFEVAALPKPEGSTSRQPPDVAEAAHAHWLGCDMATDAAQTAAHMGDTKADWLVVDHYALDVQWEQALQPFYRQLLVIDDLADRGHLCDVLLDQNMVDGLDTRYQGQVPDRCICLLGPRYALLRPDFFTLRSGSLARRTVPRLDRLFVFLGGSDTDNDTGKVIAGIKQAKRHWRHIDVVVGQEFPAMAALKHDLTGLPSAQLHVQTPDMASLMAAADLALTAGGSVTWEKCALGLPSLVVIQADNQSPIATKMHELGAQRTLGQAAVISPFDYASALDQIHLDDLTGMTQAAAAICDGSGIESVLKNLGINR